MGKSQDYDQKKMELRNKTASTKQPLLNKENTVNTNSIKSEKPNRCCDGKKDGSEKRKKQEDKKVCKEIMWKENEKVQRKVDERMVRKWETCIKIKEAEEDEQGSKEDTKLVRMRNCKGLKE